MLFAVATYATARVAWGDSISHVNALSEVTLMFSAIAASIPIGFILYQIYYWRYSPHLWGTLVSRDRGRDALSGLSPELLNRLRTLFDARLDLRRHHQSVDWWPARKLHLLRLDEGLLRERYKTCDTDVPEPTSGDDETAFHERDDRSPRRIYRDNWYENWDVFCAVLDLVATRGKAPAVRQNFATLYEIYHALGASRVAIALGPGIAAVYAAAAHWNKVQQHLEASLIALFLVMSLVCGLTYVIHRARLSTWKSAVQKVRLDLRWCLEGTPDLLKTLPEADGFTPRIALRRPDNARAARVAVNSVAIRVALLVGAVLIYGLGAIRSDDNTRVGDDLGPMLLLLAAVAFLLIIASWWPRRLPVLLIPAAAIEAAGVVAFAVVA